MVWSSFLRSHRGTNVLSVVRPASDHNTAQFLLHPPHTGAATSQRQVASHVRRYQTKFVSSTGTSEVKVVAWWTATRSSNIASPPQSANSHLVFFLFLHFGEGRRASEGRVKYYHHHQHSLSAAASSVQGVAMSTAAVTPFRSFVQTPIFSVSPSSFSLQRI